MERNIRIYYGCEIGKLRVSSQSLSKRVDHDGQTKNTESRKRKRTGGELEQESAKRLKTGPSQSQKSGADQLKELESKRDKCISWLHNKQKWQNKLNREQEALFAKLDKIKERYNVCNIAKEIFNRHYELKMYKMYSSIEDKESKKL